MYGTKQHSKKCMAVSVYVRVRATTCYTALHSPAACAVECTVCFRSAEVAERSPETCVISTEVISCSWRAAWLSSCSVCEEPGLSPGSLFTVHRLQVAVCSHTFFALSCIHDIPNKDIPAWIIQWQSFRFWILQSSPAWFFLAECFRYSIRGKKGKPVTYTLYKSVFAPSFNKWLLWFDHKWKALYNTPFD